jgi:hypothetical protein
MSRFTTTLAVSVAAPVLLLGLAGCKDSSTASPSAGSGGSNQPSATTPEPGTPADPESPADAETPSGADTPTAAANPGGGDGEICSDLQWLLDTTQKLQQGQAGDEDPHAAADHVNSLLQKAPADIQRATQGLSGATIIALRHPEVAERQLGTDGIKADITQLDTWHQQNC